MAVAPLMNCRRVIFLFWEWSINHFLLFLPIIFDFNSAISACARPLRRSQAKPAIRSRCQNQPRRSFICPEPDTILVLENVLSGTSTSEEIDAAIVSQSGQIRFEVLTFESEGAGRSTFPGVRGKGHVSKKQGRQGLY